jgi:hypothetical protein
MRRTIITTLVWSTFIFVVLAVVACRSLKLPTIAAGETCFRCRHVIADARLGTEMLNGSLPTKYKGPRCMATYLKEHPDRDARLFVTDYNTGAMFNPERAWFVPVVTNARTGGWEYRAYRSRDAANAAAEELGVKTLRWSELLAGA